MEPQERPLDESELELPTEPMLLQDKLQSGDRRPGVVRPRLDPVQNPKLGIVKLRRSRSA